MTNEEVRLLLRLRCEAEFEGQSALARKLNISRQYLNDVITGIAPPSQKILEFLGLEWRIERAEK